MDKKQKQITELERQIGVEISDKINCRVQFSIEQPDKNVQFFEPTVTLTEDKKKDPKETKYRSRIYLTSQESIIYYFPTPTHKLLVEKAAKILEVMTGAKVTVKEAPCKTCPNILKCRLSFPCSIHFQQIGSFTETSCVLRQDLSTFEKEFVSEAFNPIP